jgi:hypothetical protein
MFDGVRAEQEHMRADYNEAVRTTLWTADRLWKGCVPHVFTEHLHQVGMLRRVIETIETPLMLFIEQDTPLVTDLDIDWASSIDMVSSGKADIIRFYHEAVVPRGHEHLMRKRQGDFLRTTQFSARPHLASTDYYRRILTDHFTPDANCFTEDVMHSVCQSWPSEHKLFIYAPEGNFKRSYHTDGRAGGEKYDSAQVF